MSIGPNAFRTGLETPSPPELPLRRDKRYTAREVPWLRRARFKYGADVQIVNISANGIRVNHHGDILIGAPVVFEFSTTAGVLSVQARVIHCHEVEISGWLSYEIGCRFAHALPWFAQDISNTSACDIVDLLDPPQNPSGREPLWREHMVASCCELAASVWLTVTLILVLASWAAKFLST